MLSDDQEIYLDLIRAGVGKITAAREIGTSAAAMERYTATDQEFANAVEEALAERLERVVNKVWEKAQAGDSKELELVLVTQAPREWARPNKEYLLKIQQVPEMSQAELEEMHRRLTQRAEAIDVEEVEQSDG